MKKAPLLPAGLFMGSGQLHAHAAHAAHATHVAAHATAS
jgi:hypothetical protein